MPLNNLNSIRPPFRDNFRARNYWTTQDLHEPQWYAWEPKNPAKISHEGPTQVKSDLNMIVKEDVRNYLLSSTLHGLRYIGDKKLTWCERCFWLFAFGCSLIGAVFFIMNVYNKWISSPMIVSINPQNMALGSLPFPALTICNVNQAKKSVAERYVESGDPVNEKLLQSLCSSRDDSEIFENDIAVSADWDHTRSFLINVTQPCNEMLAMCEWNSKTMNCQELFNAQLTDEGLCCTFNVVHRKMLFRNPKALNDLNLTFPLPAVDWTPEDGYPPDAPDDGFPWRPKGIGTKHGLQLVLDANIAEYYCASTKSAGFKMLLHNPTETPKIRNIGEIYGPGIEVRAVIRPRITDAQPTLRTVDISKRLCLFSSEKELVFFRTYTLKNCEMECEARAMLETCNCVYYYMPKNTSTRVCGKADARCYTNMSLFLPEGRYFWTKPFEEKMFHDTADKSLGVDTACLECLPACTEIAYFERVSSAPLTKNQIKDLAEDLDNRTVEYFIENMLVIHFYFEENTFMRYTKGEIFGLTEFVANTGGLLGLCMGFSVMSLVELLYHLTLRAYCQSRQRKPKHPFTT